VRGKILLWLTLIALLVGFSIPSFGFASSTVIFVDPPFITGLLPGDAFAVDIYITGAVNVHAWEVKLGYAPYMNLLSVTDIIEGPFLMGGGPTDFEKFNDPFFGYAHFGATGLPPHGGVGGGGILASVVFMVLEAGECEFTLYETKLLNIDQAKLDHSTEDGYYLGLTADLVPPDWPTERPIGGGHAQREWKELFKQRWGTAYEMPAEVVNTGYAPLWCRASFTSVNEITGETVVLYTGQNYLPTETYRTEVLYVNEYDPFFEEWALFGSSPYLDAPDDGSYTEGYYDGTLSDWFGFEDVTLGPVDTITNVKLEGYCRADSSDVDIDVYTWGPVPFAWLGSLYGANPTTFTWVSPRWIGTDVSDEVPLTLTEAGLNDLVVVLYYYAPWEDPPGSEGPATVDCLKLIVTIRTGGVVPPEGDWWLVEPGETLALPPATWYLEKQNTGKWYTTIAMEYRYYDPYTVPSILYAEGDTTFTYEWWCVGEGL